MRVELAGSGSALVTLATWACTSEAMLASCGRVLCALALERAAHVHHNVDGLRIKRGVDRAL